MTPANEKELSAEDLDVLERLHAEATGGTWRTAWDDKSLVAKDDGEEALIASDIGDPFDAGFVVGTLWHDGPRAAGKAANARAIAALHNVAPALFALARDGLAMRALREECGPMVVRMDPDRARLHALHNAVARHLGAQEGRE